MGYADAGSFGIGAIAIFLQPLFLDLIDVAIIELVPNIIMLGIGNIVPCLRNTHMHNNSLQRVPVALEVLKITEGELEVSIDLVAIVTHVLKPLEHEGQVGRQGLDLNDLFSSHLPLALVAVVCVLVVQDLRLEVVVEGILQVVEVFHLDAQTGELFLLFRLVLALLAADYRSLLAVEQPLHEVVVRRDRVLYAVQQQVSELVDVHLHVNTGITAFDALEGLEEVSVKVGLPAVAEMQEDLLELVDEVLFLVVVLGELGLEEF